MALDLSALDGDFGAELHANGTGVAARAPLALFEEDPDNPRFEPNPEAFDALVEDVRERGILQPIIVRRTADGKLRIRFGSRRYRAAVHVALADVPYVVTDDERQFDDYAQVSENERRAPLQPLELATFVAKKLAQGEKKKAVAARLRMDPSALTHLLSLVGEVPPFVLELYHSRKCRSPQYLYELRRLGEQQEHLVAQRCAEALDIDRRLIVALTEEVALRTKASRSAKASKPVRGGAAVDAAAVQDNPQVHRSVGGSPAGPKTEKPVAQIGKSDEPTAGVWPTLLRPCLLGLVDGQEVRVDLTLLPSSRVFMVVQDRQGVMREVPIGEIQLTSLSEADH